MTAQVAADLRAAADVLQREGWTQRAYRDEQGCHCQAGALITVLGGDPSHGVTSVREDQFHRYTAAQSALARHLGDGAISWNDDEDRTADEVIAALKAAADAAETRGTHGER